MSTADFTIPSDSKEQCSTQIAASFDLCKCSDYWLTPPQRRKATNCVRLDESDPTCSYPEYQVRRITRPPA